MGNKKACIEIAKSGRYVDDHVLMIGDAPAVRLKLSIYKFKFLGGLLNE